jgi:tetratricopeptide (TPR) repeat protein
MVFREQQKAIIRRLSIAFVGLLFIMIHPVLAEETDDFIHYQLGVKYKNQNKYDQALEEFRKMLTTYPDNYNAYMQIAEIRRAQGQPRLMIYNLKKALAYNPGWGKAQKLLGEAYEQDRQYQNSIIEYQHYQQTCDPNELDTIQAKINKLVRKVKGEPEPAQQAVTSAPTKDTAGVKAGESSKTVVEKQKTPEKKTVASLQTTSAPAKRMPLPISAPPTVESFFNQAVVLYNEGKFEESLGFLKQAIMIQRNFPPAYFYAGMIRFKLGQNDLAKTNFLKAFAYPEGEALSHFYLGKIYGAERNFKDAIFQLTVFLKRQGDAETRKEALTLLKQYKSATGDTSPLPEGASAQGGKTSEEEEPIIQPLAPETSLTTIEMRIDSLLDLMVVDTLTDPGQAMLSAAKEFKAGRFDGAIKEFKKVAVSYPAKTVAPQCMYDIGVCYMKMRLFSNAENQFEQVLDRYPSHELASKSSFFKAYSYLERGELSRAEKFLREFIQKYRTHAWVGRAYEKLGDLYMDLLQTGKALDAYSQAAAQAGRATDRTYSLYKLGCAYFGAGNPQRAMETLKKLIENGDKDKSPLRVPDSYFRIADYLYQQKNYKDALEYYQKAARKFPTYQETPWGMFQIGNIFKNTKNYQKAIETYKLLARTYPDDYWARQAKWKMEDAVWENEYRSVLN